MPPLILLPSLALAAAMAQPPDGIWDVRNQQVETPPVSARLRVVAEPQSIAEPLVLQIEASVPSLSLEEALATGQPARFRPEPELGDWLRIPHLPLKQIEPGETRLPDGTLTLFHWTCRWEADLPGDYILPALRIAFRPVSPSSQALETAFAPIPVTVPSLITVDLSAAEPRPAVTALPRSPFPVPRWLLLSCVVILWIAVRFGYRWFWHARNRRTPVLSSQPPHAIALAQLGEARTALDAYRVLCRFLLESSGIDLAKTPPEELRQHPRLDASARRALTALVKELQPGAFAAGDAPFSPALRDQLQEFLRLPEA